MDVVIASWLTHHILALVKMEISEEPVKWTVELEVALFRSMSGHKPVGEWLNSGSRDESLRSRLPLTCTHATPRSQ